MRDFAIFTDNGCDIADSVLERWDVECVRLSYNRNSPDIDRRESKIGAAEFYQAMREGTVFHTAAPGAGDFYHGFERALKDCRDVLYLGLSSGLSNTVNAARIAAEDLHRVYPQARIQVIDTLCASAGLGLLVYLAVKKKSEGAGFQETASTVRCLMPAICHWFTVEDLTYLKRGGRISTATALMGGLLNIKPVMHMDDAGKLANVTKVRGRKHSVMKLAEKYAELAQNPENGEYFISHGDCPDDARALEAAIAEKYGHGAALITDIGPVIGAHSGPGTLALFFVGKQR